MQKNRHIVNSHKKKITNKHICIVLVLEYKRIRGIQKNVINPIYDETKLSKFTMHTSQHIFSVYNDYIQVVNTQKLNDFNFLLLQQLLSK